MSPSMSTPPTSESESESDESEFVVDAAVASSRRLPVYRWVGLGCMMVIGMFGKKFASVFQSLLQKQTEC